MYRGYKQFNKCSGMHIERTVAFEGLDQNELQYSHTDAFKSVDSNSTIPS